MIIFHYGTNLTEFHWIDLTLQLNAIQYKPDTTDEAVKPSLSGESFGQTATETDLTWGSFVRLDVNGVGCKNISTVFNIY